VLLQGTDSGFYRRFMRMLVFHVRFLRRIVASSPDGVTRFRVRIALAMASVAMPSSSLTLKRAGQALDREIDRQILQDGGHISRNPRASLELLLDLLPLRQTYVNLGHDVPVRLIPGIDRMYPALRFFRHQDGDLALFNGATSTLANELMSVLRYDETAGQAFKALPHTKYHRLAAGQAVVIVDAGAAASTDLSRTAHAGCLSFEMSSGKTRFIINSGAPEFAGDRFMQAARATAAHSTVTLNDTSSCQFSKSKSLGPIMVGGVKKVIVERAETEDGRDYVRAAHDGYLSAFGYVHEREISLNASGTIVAGRDRFFTPEGKKHQPKGEGIASARFHIHPSISLLQTETDAALLIAPDGVTWVLSSPGNEVLAAEDISFPDRSGMRSSDPLEIVYKITEKPEFLWFLPHRP